MKKILLFCFLLCLISCEIQYDGETKIVLTGKLIDENGNSLPNKDIEVTINGGGTLFSNSDLISFGKSNQDGSFSLIFPTPKNDNEISISINNQINQANEFQEKEFSVKKINFKNYKLDLNKITLYKKESITNLNLVLNRTSTNTRLENIKIEGKLPEFWINPNLLPDNSDYVETFYNVIKNQNITLKYTIIDYSNSTITSKEETVIIPINDTPVTYNLTY
ncbi:hypothetical protein [Flavobacterium flavipallidum]|uniref:Carboxypeptidase regulatory-like domain-containing protein n=1 Tax=Flavobacterium flavipallidum TaxID=3139140 RepID=A0ABU9HP26_9FLAO